MMASIRYVVMLAALGVAGCGDDGGSDLARIDCDVVIVGGGVGGLHTAFRLAPTLGSRVCLFEKENELGGRIKDVPMTDGDPNSPRFGVGARRVMEGQQVLLDLATELGLALETPDTEADLVNARGGYGFSKDALASRYPGLKLDPDNDDHETYLYDTLRFDAKRGGASSYPDFRSYIRDVAGTSGFDFLHDMSRFRADFEYPLDARGYLDYLDEEWDVCCTPSYPVGGMSAFIRGMAEKATAAGVRIFKGSPVAEVARSGDGYRVVTATHEAHAAKLVIAVPPVAFPYIEGDVMKAIAEQPQFKDLIAVKVATVTQWWPNNWWSTIANPAGAAPNNNVWRAWTTEHCLNFIEIPLEPYGVAQNVTRSVYDDDANCVEFWEQTAARGTAAVDAEIKRGLERLFVNNGATTPASVTIPNPTKTYVQIWPAAWHWIRAGSVFTNQNIFDWAVEPLSGEQVALVGEAYHPRRSGWSDAAYKSSLNLLAKKYGMTTRIAPTPKRGRDARWTRSLGGN